MKPGYKQTEVGVIPEEREVKSLGELATIATGHTPSTSNPRNYGDEFPFVGPVDLGNSKFISLMGSRWGQSSLFDINRIYLEHISFGKRTFGSAFCCTMQDSCR